jgi:ribonucleoside-triphosphate reductase
MLQNGTVISEVMIEKPHSFATACNIATQIIAQVASSQYGGQTISLTHLAPFVEVSRQKIRKEVVKELEGVSVSAAKINEIVESRVKDEINRGVQTIQYQVVTLMTTNGQAPFLSVFMYLNEAKDERTKKDLALIIEEVLRQRIQGVKNKDGVWVTPAFPKLLYVLEDDNVYPDSEYYYLTELAAKCTAKRLVPDYISEKKMLEYKIDANGNGNCYGCMGCRSFLTPYVDSNGNPKYYGRFNQGVVTINLVDVALSSEGDIDRFWDLMEQRTELCHKALQFRHQRLEGTPSDVAPILWQNGAIARLEKGEKIDKLLHNGYSTISLGYAGLYECVKYMTGHSHTDNGIGEEFGLQVMQKLNDKCKEWKEAEHIDYSLYGTPIESTTYKFAKCLKKRFGEIEGITDKNYITNSYHVPVFEEINAFDKLALESKFQKLSPGGAISYVEVPDLTHNIPIVIQIIQFIYENIMYAELNTKSDYCSVCGYDGEIKIITDERTGKLIWECPKCGNHDQNKMSVARRTCGYIGSQFWNQGRTQEIKERVLHIDDKEFDDTNIGIYAYGSHECT